MPDATIAGGAWKGCSSLGLGKPGRERDKEPPSVTSRTRVGARGGGQDAMKGGMQSLPSSICGPQGRTLPAG